MHCLKTKINIVILTELAGGTFQVKFTDFCYIILGLQQNHNVHNVPSYNSSEKVGYQNPPSPSELRGRPNMCKCETMKLHSDPILNFILFGNDENC